MTNKKLNINQLVRAFVIADFFYYKDMKEIENSHLCDDDFEDDDCDEFRWSFTSELAINDVNFWIDMIKNETLRL